jgi:threonine/homoserine/homoserine lactone efflux protein
VAIYAPLALLASRARGWLAGHPAAQVAAGRTIGVLLIGAALFTAVEGWRAIER